MQHCEQLLRYRLHGQSPGALVQFPPAHACAPAVPGIPHLMHSQHGIRDPLCLPVPREACGAGQGLQGLGANEMEKQESGLINQWWGRAPSLDVAEE